MVKPLTLAVWLMTTSMTLAAEDILRPGMESTPNPDPTRLTTSALLREITTLQREMDALHKSLEQANNALQKIIETRLDGSDKAIKLLQERTDKLPTDIDVKLASVKELLSEKFRSQELLFDGVQLQFKERDERVSQLSKSNETAINAALQSQKEAFAQQNLSFDRSTQKAEGNFTEQIKQLSALIQEGRKALDDKITTGTKVSDEKLGMLDTRLTRVESTKIGEVSAKGDQNTSTTLVIAVVGTLLSLVAVCITLIVAFKAPPRINGRRDLV